jgi:hypothetical protein
VPSVPLVPLEPEVPLDPFCPLVPLEPLLPAVPEVPAAVMIDHEPVASGGDCPPLEILSKAIQELPS